MDNRFIPDDKRGEKKYSIEKVWDHHHAIKRMLVATNGKFTNKEIAEAVGCTPQTVSNVRNDPMVRALIDDMQGKADEKAIDVSQKVKEMFPLAAKVLENTMRLAETEEDVAMIDSKVLSQSVRSAVTVLDHAHPKTTQGLVMHGHLTMEQIEALKKKARGEIEPIDVEVEAVG